MRKIPEERLKKLEEEVKKEFPGDYALQQVHLARLIIEEKTKGLTGKELIAYLRKQAKKAREKL